MAILDPIKQLIEKLNGEQARKQREAELAAQQLAHDQREQAKRMADLDRAAAEKAAERSASEKAAQERIDRGGPAMRMIPSHAEFFKTQRMHEVKPDPPRVAEPLIFQPTGLQGPPSPGGPGIRYAPAAAQPRQQEPPREPSPESLTPVRIAPPVINRESFTDQIIREEKERQERMTPAQRDAEQKERARQRAIDELNRSLHGNPEDGNENHL